MGALTLDDGLLASLRQVQEQVEVRDSQGNLIGLFTPVRNGAAAGLWRGSEADLPELERRWREEKGQGRPTSEVVKYLMTLTTDPTELADLQRHLDAVKERDQCSPSS